LSKKTHETELQRAQDTIKSNEIIVKEKEKNEEKLKKELEFLKSTLNQLKLANVEKPKKEKKNKDIPKPTVVVEKKPVDPLQEFIDKLQNNDATLKELKLESKNLNDSDVMKIFDASISNTKLKVLSFANNPGLRGTDFIPSIIDFLKKNKTLTEFAFSF
jgi:hypothetical protein